jgi:hypothetical protein
MRNFDGSAQADESAARPGVVKRRPCRDCLSPVEFVAHAQRLDPRSVPATVAPMRSFFCRLTFLLALALAPWSLLAHEAEPPAPRQTVSEITALLGEFLERVDDPAMHARFWADDLIYTSGLGEVKTKAQIVTAVTAAANPGNAAPRTSYGADDVRVRPYGRFAALTFRLLVRNPDGTQWHSRNSGAFLWRDGQWQVVTWQATREPDSAAAR